MTSIALQPRAVPVSRDPTWRILIEAGVFAAGAVMIANVSRVLGLAALALGMMYLLANKRILQALFLFVIILLLVDSRMDLIQPAKDLRLPAVGILAAYSLLMAGSIRVARPVFWILPFLAVAVFAATRGVQPSLALSKTTSYFFIIVVAFQFGTRLTAKWPQLSARLLHTVIATWVWVGLAMIVFARGVAFFGESGRFRGLMGNPDGIGVLVILALPFQLALLDTAAPEHRRNLKLTILATVLSGLLCGSRGALIGMLVVVLVRWLMRGRWPTKIAALSLMAALIAGTLYAISLSDRFVDTPAGELLRARTLATGGGRFLAWTYAMDYIREAPWVGRGFAFDEFVFDDDHRQPIFNIGIGGHQGGVHNGYLAFLLNTGFIGLGLYLTFLIAVVRSTRQFVALAPLLAVVVWSSVVEAWMASSLNSFTFLFFLEMLLIARLAADAQHPTNADARTLPSHPSDSFA